MLVLSRSCSYHIVMFIGVDSSFLFFFFKHKTAYEMRISDWSSDVCSSDLILDRVVDELRAVIGRNNRDPRRQALLQFVEFRPDSLYGRASIRARAQDDDAARDLAVAVQQIGRAHV